MKKTQVMNGLLALMTAAALTLAAMPVRADQSKCGPREAMVERLSTKFNETRRGIGLNTGGRIMEIWASEASGSWTVTVTMPDGRTCLVATGQAWEDRMDDLAHLADADA